VEKPERFLRRLFQAPVEIIKKKDAEGLLVRFPSGAAVSTARAAGWQKCPRKRGTGNEPISNIDRQVDRRLWTILEAQILAAGPVLTLLRSK
jgi:hypothetical protein